MARSPRCRAPTATAHNGASTRGLVHHWRLSTVAARTPDEHAVVLTQLLDLEGLDVVVGGDRDRDQLVGARGDVPAAQDGDALVPRRALRRARPRHQVGHAHPLREPEGGRRGPDRERRRRVRPVRRAERGRGPRHGDDVRRHLRGRRVPGRCDRPGGRDLLEALYAHAAALRAVELVEPRAVIGQSTEEAIQSGVLYGFAAQVDGMCARFTAVLGECTSIATGGLSSLIAPYTTLGPARRALAHAPRPADHLGAQRGDARERAAHLLRPRRLRPRRRGALRRARSRRGVRDHRSRSPAASCSCALRASSRSQTLRDSTGEVQLFGGAAWTGSFDAVRRAAHRGLGGRDRRGRADQGAASCRSRWRRSSCSPRPSSASGTSGSGSPTPTCATGTARPTCGRTRSRAPSSIAATRSCAPCASSSGAAASSRWRRRSSTPCPPGAPRSASRRTTTRSTPTCSCASRPSCG